MGDIKISAHTLPVCFVKSLKDNATADKTKFPGTSSWFMFLGKGDVAADVASAGPHQGFPLGHGDSMRIFCLNIHDSSPMWTDYSSTLSILIILKIYPSFKRHVFINTTSVSPSAANIIKKHKIL